ncbi:DUF6318 family protein [Isoptericola sp. NEAU-Y5]|uniref:DUF6318 family protein n=1 Tax=Isoptericola luteus TaxID=2879484 RepID=A0ABS7ZBC7_9MICO|nr:DUF6318 family protein [Isoptericola sp. NEAU-Y5]MCA5892351.1 DUF6318 family protein [Isoptericola sp. NEAU-Y5]
MPRATLAATAVGLAAVLLLAGCGPDGPEPPPAASESTTPGPSLSASPSVSPSPTSTVAPPERPVEMDDDGPAGAEAAAVYFLRLDDYIMKTGDTAQWEAMSHKECDYCVERLEQAQEIADHSYAWTNELTEVRVQESYVQDSATGLQRVDVAVSQGAVTVTDGSGDEVFQQDAIELVMGVELALADEDWVIVGITNVTDS